MMATRQGESQQLDHPFHNSVILQTIFDNCSSSDWRNFRLVCKAWFKQLLHPWRKSAHVHLFYLSPPQHDEEPESYNLFPHLFSAVTDPKDFMEFNRKPFHHLSIRNRTVDLNGWPRQEILFRRVGPWLHSLTLSKIFISELPAFERLLFKHTPNLETLTYSCCRYWEQPNANEPPREYVKPAGVQCNLKSVSISIRKDDIECPPPFPIDWITFFTRFPNVETLDLSQFSGETAPNQFLKIIEAIKVVRTATDNTTVNIKCLNVQDFIYSDKDERVIWNEEEPEDEEGNVFTEESLEVLRSLDLPLTSLSISLKKLPVQKLIKLLKIYPDLQSLSMKDEHVIGEHYSESFDYQCLPPKLTRLELEGPIFPDWGFMPVMTQLETLIVNTSKPFYHVDVLLDIPRRAPDLPECALEKLTSFYFSHSSSLSDRMANFFVKTMPNVKRAKVTVDPESFGIICGGWPEVEELEVCRVQCTNDQFLHNIAKLKDFKSLIIHHGKIDEVREGQTAEPKRLSRFGETSIQKYFLQLPQLTKLSALFSQEVNASAFQALQKAIKDTSQCQVVIDFPAMNKSHRISLKEYMTYMDVDECTTPEEVRDAVDRKHFNGLFKRLAQIAGV